MGGQSTGQISASGRLHNFIILMATSLRKVGGFSGATLLGATKHSADHILHQ